MTETTMRETWLVQRLEKPRSGGVFGPDNPFAFGGGMKNGGLSEEAMSLLRTIFTFDYMGSAEFEFGAVPKALQGLAKDAADLTADTIEIPLAKVAKHWQDKSTEEPAGSATVYILARRTQLVEVKKRIRAMAAKDYQFKEATHLPLALRPSGNDDWLRTAGWLELDNGFAFFADRDMWASTCALFGVDVDAAVSA